MARVLICDDALAFGILFERWMAECGISVVGHAGSQREALAMAKEHEPDVIVVDHLLRDATSDRLLPTLREVVPRSKVVLISGMPPADLAETAATVGADAFVSKAATAQEMCDVVESLLP